MEVIDLTDEDPDFTSDDVPKNNERRPGYIDFESDNEAQMSLLMEVWDGSPESGTSSSTGERAASSTDKFHGCETEAIGAIRMHQTVNASCSTEADLELDTRDGTQEVKALQSQVTGSCGKESCKHVSQNPNKKTGGCEDSSSKSGVTEIIDLTEEEEEPLASENTPQRLNGAGNTIGNETSGCNEESLPSKTRNKNDSPTSLNVATVSTEQYSSTETADSCFVDLTECDAVKADLLVKISSLTHETPSNVEDFCVTNDSSLNNTRKVKDSQTFSYGKETLVNKLKGEDLSASDGMDLDDEVAAILGKGKSFDLPVQSPPLLSLSASSVVTIHSTESSTSIYRSESPFRAITEDPDTRSETNVATGRALVDDASLQDTDTFELTLRCSESGFDSSCNSSRCSSPTIEQKESEIVDEKVTVSSETSSSSSMGACSSNPSVEELEFGLLSTNKLLNNATAAMNLCNSTEAPPSREPRNCSTVKNDTYVECEKDNEERTVSARSPSVKSIDEMPAENDKKSGVLALRSLRIENTGISDSESTNTAAQTDVLDKFSDHSLDSVTNEDTIKANSVEREKGNQEKMPSSKSRSSEEWKDKVEKDKKSEVVQALLSLRMEITSSVLDSNKSTEEQNSRVLESTAPKEGSSDECQHQSLLEQEVALVLASICDRRKNIEPTRPTEGGSLARLEDTTWKDQETQSDLEVVQNHKDNAVKHHEDTIGHHSLLPGSDTEIDQGTSTEIMELYEGGTAAFEAHSPLKDTSAIVNITLSPVQPRSPNSPKKLPCSPQSTVVPKLALCERSPAVSQVENTEEKGVEKQTVPTSCFEATSPDLKACNQVQSEENVLDTEELEKGDQGPDESVKLQEHPVLNVNSGKLEKENSPEESETQKTSEEERLEANKRKEFDNNKEESDNSKQTLHMKEQNEKLVDICEEQEEKDIENVRCSLDVSSTDHNVIEEAADSENVSSSSECEDTGETTAQRDGNIRLQLDQRKTSLDAVPSDTRCSGDLPITDRKIAEKTKQNVASSTECEDSNKGKIADQVDGNKHLHLDQNETSQDASDLRHSPDLPSTVCKVTEVTKESETISNPSECEHNNKSEIAAQVDCNSPFHHNQKETSQDDVAFDDVICSPVSPSTVQNVTEVTKEWENLKSPKCEDNNKGEIAAQVNCNSLDQREKGQDAVPLDASSLDLPPTVHQDTEVTKDSEHVKSASGHEDNINGEIAARVEYNSQFDLEQKEESQETAPSEEDVQTQRSEQTDNSGSSSINSPLCKDIDFSQLDLSPNSSIGDAILDFVQQAHANIQEVLEEAEKNTESDPSHCSSHVKDGPWSVELPPCSKQDSDQCNGKRKRQDSIGSCGLNELMDEIGKLCDTKDGDCPQEDFLKEGMQQDMHRKPGRGPEARQELDNNENLKAESLEDGGTQGLDGFVRQADNIGQSIESSGEGERSPEGRTRADHGGTTFANNRKENSSVTMATSSASTMGQVSLWDLMDHQGPFIIYPSLGRGGEGVMTAVRNQSAEPGSTVTNNSPTVTEDLSGLGNAVYSALAAVNEDCTEDQEDKSDEPTTMLDLDTHTLTTTGGMVLRSGHSTGTDQCVGHSYTEGAEPCVPEIENASQVIHSSDGGKESEGESENDCPPELDLQAGVMTRARARRLQQMFEEATPSTTVTVSTASAPVTTHYTNSSHQFTRMEDMNAAAKCAEPPGDMDAVAMAMMCSGLEDDAPEYATSRRDEAQQGWGLNTRDGEGHATCQIIHCIPGANVTQTINRAHPDLLPTVITSMSTLAGHQVTSLTIQGQEFYFLEEVAYEVYNHTVSYVLNRCNCLQISRIRCKGEYLEFLRPYCRFIDRRSNHCYLIRGEDAELLHHSFIKLKKVNQKTTKKKRGNVSGRCSHCGQDKNAGRKRGRKRQAEATVSVNPESHLTDRLQEDTMAASVLQSSLGEDNPFTRAAVSSHTRNATLVRTSIDATCQTDEAGESLQSESWVPPKKRHCDGVASTACQTAKCSLMDQCSGGLGTSSGETSSAPDNELRRFLRRRHESRSSMVTSTSHSQSVNFPAESSTNQDEHEITTFYVTTKVVGTRLQRVDISVRNDKGEELASNVTENRDSEDQGYSETVEETPVSPVEGLGSGEELEFSNKVEKLGEVEDLSSSDEFQCKEDQAELRMEGSTVDQDSGISSREVFSIDELSSPVDSDVSPPVTCTDQLEEEGTSYRFTEASESAVFLEQHGHDVMGEDEEDMEEVLSIMQESGIEVSDKHKEIRHNAEEESVQDMYTEDVMMAEEEHHMEDEEDLGEIMSIMQDSGIEVAGSLETASTNGENALQDVLGNESVMEQETSDEDNMEDVTSIMAESGISLADDVATESHTHPKDDKRGAAEVEKACYTTTLDQNKNEVFPSEKSLTANAKRTCTEGDIEVEQNMQEEPISMVGCKVNTSSNLVANVIDGKREEEQTTKMSCTAQNEQDQLEDNASELDTEIMPSLYPIQAIIQGKLCYSDTEAKYSKPSPSRSEEILDQAVEDKNQTLECSPSSINPSLHFEKEYGTKSHLGVSGSSTTAPIHPNNSPKLCILPNDCVTPKKSERKVTRDCAVCLWHCSPLLVSHTSKGGAFTNWGYLYPHWCAAPQDNCIYCPVCNAFFSVSVYLGHFHEKGGTVVHRGSYGLQLESRQANGEQKRLWNNFAKKHPAAIKGCATPQKRQKEAARHNMERCKRKLSVRLRKIKNGSWKVSSSSKGCVWKDGTTKIKAVSKEDQNDNVLVENASCSSNQCAAEYTATAAEEQQTVSYCSKKVNAENVSAKEQQTSLYSANQCATENTAAAQADQQAASSSKDKCSTEITVADVEQQTVSYSASMLAAENTSAGVDEKHTAAEQTAVTAVEQQTSYSTSKSAAAITAAGVEEQQMISCSTRRSAEEDTIAVAVGQQSESYSTDKCSADGTVAVLAKEQTASCSTIQHPAADAMEQQTASYSTIQHPAENTASNAVEQQTASGSKIQHPAENTASNAVEQQTASSSKEKSAEENTPEVASHNSTTTEPIGSSTQRNSFQGHSSFSSILKGKPRGRRTGGKPGGGQKTNPSNMKNLPKLKGKLKGKMVGDEPRDSKSLKIEKAAATKKTKGSGHYHDDHQATSFSRDNCE
uniref:SKI/SNO/DAC domain-containing protein n=1 Tax=Branchiostoma floridae TaxID=7739 RepID=C3Y6U9_BRAFL|eukprot:XP_002608049.1 hypothetical protein BRAFLDRAFT_74998 [Branchiostoma floridae]